jgi:hypothetical protein
MMIREAVEKDASALSVLLAQLGYPASADEILTRILLYKPDGYRLMMCEVNDRPVGFIALHWYHAFQP